MQFDNDLVLDPRDSETMILDTTNTTGQAADQPQGAGFGVGLDLDDIFGQNMM